MGRRPQHVLSDKHTNLERILVSSFSEFPKRQRLRPCRLFFEMDASSTSSQNEIDFVEQEYHSLRRQYRIMEGDRNTYQQKARHHINRQQRLIDRLRKEEEDLTTDLKLAQSNRVRKKDNNNLTEIRHLSSAQQVYMETVILEREKLADLKKKVEQLQNEIHGNTKTHGSSISQHKLHVDRLKNIRVLENRHNTATVQFNKLLTDNMELRTSIEHYRNQRKVFNTLYRRLTSKIQAQKGQVATVIDTATVHYDQRDEALTKMISLHERNDQDLNHFISEYKEMNRVIANESKLQSFMNTKNSELSELAMSIEKERSCGRAVKAEHIQQEEMIKFEKVLDAIINVLGNDQGKRLTDILNSGNVNKLVKSLCTAIKPVCDRYRKTEEQNYSLFQFVNEMSLDVKRLEEKLNHIADDDAAEKSEFDRKMSNVSTEVDNLEHNWPSHTSESQEMESMLLKYQEELVSLQDQIVVLFGALKCDDSEISALLDSKDHINDQTLEIYLSVIENKINGLVEYQMVSQLDAEDKQDKPTRGTTPKTPASRSAPRETVMPKTNKKKADLQNVQQSYEIIDTQFSDLDADPLDENELDARAIQIIDERARAALITPKTPKTPKTPRTADRRNR